MADQYIEAVINEALQYRNKGYSVDTLYIGGGTPSLLSTQQMKRLVLGLRGVFIFDEGFEFTLEANPGTVTREKAIFYRELGVNRISLGVQSIHDNELRALGRIHSYRDFLHAYRILRDAGFDNINLDIMYAIPEGTEDSLGETLDKEKVRRRDADPGKYIVAALAALGLDAPRVL